MALSQNEQLVNADYITFLRVKNSQPAQWIQPANVWLGGWTVRATESVSLLLVWPTESSTLFIQQTLPKACRDKQHCRSKVTSGCHDIFISRILQPLSRKILSSYSQTLLIYLNCPFCPFFPWCNCSVPVVCLCVELHVFTYMTYAWRTHTLQLSVLISVLGSVRIILPL